MQVPSEGDGHVTDKTPEPPQPEGVTVHIEVHPNYVMPDADLARFATIVAQGLRGQRDPFP